MSYLVLARKWRPKGFDDLIGQEPISRILSNAVSSGKIAHAYLFSGPRGVGKTSTARILAKAMNCRKGPTPSPCGICASCEAITDGSSIDVMEIDGASNNSVNDIRDLRESVRYAPAEGRFKVYIIDEAHMLSDAAFNALLKTLEEPPSHVVFVLATTAPRKIPATVLSRCQHLPFRRIPIQMITGRLKNITASEGIVISDTALEMIARSAEGSMRDSLTILDQVSAFSSEINDSEVMDLLGIADFRALSGLAEAVIRGDRGRIVEIINELSSTGTDFKSFAKDLMQFFRNVLVAKIVKDPHSVLDLSDDEIKTIGTLLNAATEDHLTLLLSEMIRMESDVRAAFAPRVALEVSLIRASFLSSLKPVQEAIRNIERYIAGKEVPTPDKESAGIEKKEKTEDKVRPLPPAEKAPSPDPAGNQASTAIHTGSTFNPDEFKKSMQDRIEALNHPLACKLNDADFRLDDNTLCVTLQGGAGIHLDSLQKNTAVLEQAAAAVLGRKIMIRFDTGTRKVPRRKELKEQVLAEPIIREAIDLFEGKIVDIRTSENSDNGGKNV